MLCVVCGDAPTYPMYKTHDYRVRLENMVMLCYKCAGVWAAFRDKHSFGHLEPRAFYRWKEFAHAARVIQFIADKDGV